MGQVLGDVFSFAVPVALSPLPIIAVTMLLLGPAGGAGGLGFLAGRVATLFALTFVLVAVAGAVTGPTGGGGEGGAWLRILLGLLLMGGAVAVWRKARARGSAAELPAWLASIERVTPAGALRMGAMLTLVNLKEVAFVVGAGAMIAGAGLATAQVAAAALVFATIASLGVAVPVAGLVFGGPGIRARLAVLRDWLLRNQAVAIAVVLLVIGGMLVGKGIGAL